MSEILKKAKEMMSEKTRVLIKPDAVMRGLVGQIISRFEQCGLKIVGMKMLVPTKTQLDKHFPKSDEWLIGMGQKTLDTYKEYNIDPIEVFGTNDPKKIGKEIKKWNYSYLLSGPVVAVVLEGLHSIDIVRKIVGHTLPYRASPGTVRGDFSINAPDLANLVKASCKNLVHASGNKEEAENEIRCWFKEEELVSFQRADEKINFLRSKNV